MNTQTQARKITVHPPKITPTFNTIGYGNPRYNSMLVHKQGVLLTVGTHLRWLNLKDNVVLYQKQIGCCQIFQLMENHKYILAVNFDGFITILSRQDLSIKYQFYGPGKQIRHSAFSDSFLAVSCELNQGTDQSLLAVYKISEIEKGIFEPLKVIRGNYYYPQYLQDNLTVVEYNDPNPKGKKRKQTVLTQKLPITNRIVKFNNQFQVIIQVDIKEEGQIICAAQNKGVVYYLHSSKRVTIFDIQKQRSVQIALVTKSYPHLVQAFKSGIVYANSSNVLTYLTYDFQNNQIKIQQISIKSLAIGGNLSLKFSPDGIYSLNQNGLHFFCQQTLKTYTQSLFNITNCGIAFNSNGSLIAVADFGGGVYIFDVQHTGTLPSPICSVFVNIPIRSLAWCKQTNNIVIGCVGGSLFWWKIGQPEAELLMQIDRTFNILRAAGSKIYAGTSDGDVKIFDSATMTLIHQYKAHHPIHYETEQQRELFGSMKNYAQIWSLALSPSSEDLYIVSSSEDQTEKVFRADLKNNTFQLAHHLKGHQLAVTSIDWQVMNEQLGEIYVSCSDDKIIRFRDPKNHFKVLFQVETTTIKEWHTLTYLALQPKGHRVAIGSQNGYLFIYDILKRQLLFGEKIHLGGIQGLDWSGNKICTCSSDLCINIIEL